MEENYSKRELDFMFAEIQKALGFILEQTTKTNGTVRWTVKMIYLSIGFCSCVALIILPLLWSLISVGKI